MADFDYRTWPAHTSEKAFTETDWVTPAGGFNSGISAEEAQTGFLPANQNFGVPEFSLTDQLPAPIVSAINEWALHLQNQAWRLRRRALSRFAESFADQFLALNPNLSDEEYESLTDIGYTCLLEKLDTGPIYNLDQAHCYKKSVHDCHRMAADSFIAMNAAAPVTIH